MFETYSHICDSFYVDKDYASECINILRIAKSLKFSMSHAIEIGAGTGSFTKELAKYFDQIEAFEISPIMAKLSSSNLMGFDNVSVSHSDISQVLSCGLSKNSFDLVIANFHVFTYLNRKEALQFVDLCKTFLMTGGIACFDFWDHEAVSATPPSQSVKIGKFRGRKITRIASPISRDNFKEIEVVFEFYESSNVLFRESHTMFPRSITEVMDLFEKEFEFCGSFDIASGLPYN